MGTQEHIYVYICKLNINLTDRKVAPNLQIVNAIKFHITFDFSDDAFADFTSSCIYTDHGHT